MREAAEAYAISFRRGSRLVGLNWSSFTYRHRPKPDERALTIRLRDLAGLRVRYGYRRLTVLLQREGWPVGKKRIYRIYKAEGLEVRTQRRKKRAAVPRVPLATAESPGQRWSMDFMADKLADDQELHQGYSTGSLRA